MPAVFWVSFLISVLLIHSLPSPKCSPVADPSHTGYTRLSAGLSPATGLVILKFKPLQHHSKNLKQPDYDLLWLDQHGEGDLDIGCVLYIWIAAAFMNCWFYVCVNDSNVYMNHWLSGTWTRLLEYDAIETCHSFYLWWHAFLLFFILFLLFLFDLE